MQNNVPPVEDEKDFDFNQDMGDPNQFENLQPEIYDGNEPFRPEEDDQFGSGDPALNGGLGEPNPLSQPPIAPLNQPAINVPPRVQLPAAASLPNKSENSEVLRWKNINMVVIALTTFMTIIFLQVLA